MLIKRLAEIVKVFIKNSHILLDKEIIQFTVLDNFVILICFVISYIKIVVVGREYKAANSASFCDSCCKVMIFTKLRLYFITINIVPYAIDTGFNFVFYYYHVFAISDEKVYIILCFTLYRVVFIYAFYAENFFAECSKHLGRLHKVVS